MFDPCTSRINKILNLFDPLPELFIITTWQEWGRYKKCMIFRHPLHKVSVLFFPSPLFYKLTIVINRTLNSHTSYVQLLWNNARNNYNTPRRHKHQIKYRLLKAVSSEILVNRGCVIRCWIYVLNIYNTYSSSSIHWPQPNWSIGVTPHPTARVNHLLLCATSEHMARPQIKRIMVQH